MFPASVANAVRPAAAVIGVLACLVVSVVLTVRHPDALVTLLPSTNVSRLHVDFDTFWHSAVALTRGADIYDTPATLTNLNPPLLTVLLVPFAALDALVAYRLFAALMLLTVVATVLAVARELRLRPVVTVAVVAAVLVSSPLHGTLLLGQIYPILLAGLTAGWIAERRGRPLLAAVLFGITVALKPSLAPVLLLAGVQRRWVPFGAGLLAAAGATLLGVLGAGPSSGIEWLAIAFTEPVPDTPDNASLPGLVVRLELPSGVGLLAGSAVLIGTLAWIGSRRDRIDPAGTAPWAVLAAGLLFSPISWHNYLTLLVPGMLVLITIGRASAAAVALAVAVVPVSWSGEWPPGGVVGDLGRSLYCAVLIGYWLVLLRSVAGPSSSLSTGAAAGSGGASAPAGLSS